MIHRVERQIEGKTLVIEAGRVARSAHGSVWVRYGDTIVLATAVSSPSPREGIDFFPLLVDYQERAYAAGKIPGSFFRREGRPHEKETLACRLIDRSLRPLFPKGYKNDVQVVAMVLSADQENDPDVLSIVGASAALTLSPIPFHGPIGAVRVGRVEGRFILNPTYAQLEESDLDLVVTATENTVVMVEAGAREVPEPEMTDAIAFGHRGLQEIIAMQRELADAVGITPASFVSPPPDPALVERVGALCREKVRERLVAGSLGVKEGRDETREALLASVLTAVAEESDAVKKAAAEIFREIEKEEMRERILREKRRADGRGLTDIRPITCEVGVLPRPHGSALFTRGQTQALVATTLGTTDDMQRLDDIEGEGTKRFMLHYNFPPFSVGEVRPMRGPGRREIGHGALAERALLPVLPPQEEFPYALRIVSDIVESNGSTSMATVCGTSLSLMDAGVPVRAAVGGIAMGLVVEKERWAVLTDIMGLEDHLGDMDFKVAGTRRGVTALQMDIKVQGITPEVMRAALEQAAAARSRVLDVMDATLAKPRPALSPYAPRIITLMIPVDKIGEVIGPGGRMIRSIIEETGVKIDISDDGKVEIASADEAAAQKALSIVSKIVEVPQVGKVYQGKVVRIMEFGAFVEILPGTDGLLHISQISDQRVKRVQDVLKEGDEVTVKVMEIDKAGKIRLSRKELLAAEKK